MRQSSSRSAIYIVIGLGLFVFAVSQWKRTSAPDTTFDINHSIASDTTAPETDAPQRNLPETVTTPPPVGTPPVGTPLVGSSQPAIALAEAPVADGETEPLPPIAATIVAPEDGFEMILEPAEMDTDVDFSSLPPQDALVGDDFDMSQSMDPSAPETNLAVTFDSSQDLDQGPDLDQDQGPDLGQDLGPDLGQDLRVAIDSSSANEQGFITPSVADPTRSHDTGVGSDSAWERRKSLATDNAADSMTIRQARQGWQRNPFLNPETRQAQRFQQPDTTAVEVELSEQLISSHFEDSVDQLSKVSNLETDSEITADLSLPTVDHETMQSVVASEDYHEASSPSVKIGLSDADAQKAVHNIEYGKSLSRRGAAFAARQEFYASLRILAQSHDKQVGGVKYTQSLRNGIIALKEAEDFIVADTESQIGLKVANVIETHTTKIISPQSAQGMTAIEAMQRYFAFASHQLARAGGQNVVAAECFYCLGKLHSVQAKQGASASNLDVAKSLVFHQAAIAADGSNYRSLNELGVLYANSGRFEESKEMLKQSLRYHQLPQAWENLAVVHQRLGEQQLAELANREFQLTSAQQSHSTIQWTDVNEFNKNAPLVQRTATQSNNVVGASADSSDSSSLKSFGSRILNRIR